MDKLCNHADYHEECLHCYDAIDKESNMHPLQAVNSARETVGYLKSKARQFPNDGKLEKIFEERAKAVQSLIDFAMKQLTTDA